MTESWKTSLCSFSNEMGKCLLSTFCIYIGVGLVQAQAFDINDRGKRMPCLCSTLFCCIGAGYNRTRTRKYLKIRGNFFLDCLIYSTPLYCCAPVQEFSECQSYKENIVVMPPSKPIPMILRPISEPSIIQSFCSMDFNEGVSIHVFPQMPEIFLVDLEDNHCESSSRTSKKSSNDSAESSEPEPPKSVSSQEPVHVVELAVQPIDGNNPQVYSETIGTCPFSFLKGDAFQPNCPPPTYLPIEVLRIPKPKLSKEIMHGLEVTKNGGLVCVDKEAIAKQKGIIGEVFKLAVSNIASGLGAVSISLPVRIFEPRSTGERLMDRFSFATKFLSEAGRSTDPVERLKLTMAFALSGLYLGTRQEKPFNPLLGETFQGFFSDGTEVYVEHTAHNPPTDHFDIIGRNFRLYGHYALDGGFSWNNLVGEFKGKTTVQFYNGQVISFSQPKFILGGIMTGDRTLNWEGELDFKDNTGLSACIRIGDDKHKWAIKRKSMKKDNFVGKIWKFDEATKKRGDIIASVYGSWLKKFVCVVGQTKEKVWEIDREIPDRHVPASIPLPSDWRYREDLLWLSKSNLEYAAAWKTRLEIRQRNDRQLRGQNH